MTRRRGLIAAGIATLLLFLAMAPAEERMRDAGGPGVIPFELAGGQERADEILAEWGREGRDAARESLWIDFGFLVAYGALLTLLLAATRDLARERGWTRMTAIGGVAVWFGALAVLLATAIGYLVAGQAMRLRERGAARPASAARRSKSAPAPPRPLRSAEADRAARLRARGGARQPGVQLGDRRRRVEVAVDAPFP